MDSTGLDSAEARLAVRFPDAYRAAVRAGASFTDLVRWRLLAPGETHHCKDAPDEALHKTEGVVIGGDDGENTLLFMFAVESSTRLADPVYVWDHTGARLGRVAVSFDEILSRRRVEDAASVLLAFSDELSGERGSAPFWSDAAPTATADEHARRAVKLVRQLVETGLLVLSSSRTEPSVAAEAAAVLAMEEDDRATAEGLVEAWLDRKDVAEVFATEDDVETLLATLRRG